MSGALIRLSAVTTHPGVAVASVAAVMVAMASARVLVVGALSEGVPDAVLGGSELLPTTVQHHNNVARIIHSNMSCQSKKIDKQGISDG